MCVHFIMRIFPFRNYSYTYNFFILCKRIMYLLYKFHDNKFLKHSMFCVCSSQKKKKKCGKTNYTIRLSCQESRHTSMMMTTMRVYKLYHKQKKIYNIIIRKEHWYAVLWLDKKNMIELWRLLWWADGKLISETPVAF